MSPEINDMSIGHEAESVDVKRLEQPLAKHALNGNVDTGNVREGLDDIACGLSDMSVRVFSGEVTVGEVDAIWDLIESLSPEVQEALSVQVNEFARATEILHENQGDEFVADMDIEAVPKPPMSNARDSPQKKRLGELGQALYDGVASPDQIREYIEKEIEAKPTSANIEIMGAPNEEELADILEERAAGKVIDMRRIVMLSFGQPNLHPKDFAELRLVLATLSDSGVIKGFEDNPNRYLVLAGGSDVPNDNEASDQADLDEKIRAAGISKSKQGRYGQLF